MSAIQYELIMDQPKHCVNKYLRNPQMKNVPVMFRNSDFQVRIETLWSEVNDMNLQLLHLILPLIVEKHFSEYPHSLCYLSSFNSDQVASSEFPILIDIPLMPCSPHYSTHEIKRCSIYLNVDMIWFMMALNCQTVYITSNTHMGHFSFNFISTFSYSCIFISNNFIIVNIKITLCTENSFWCWQK